MAVKESEVPAFDFSVFVRCTSVAKRPIDSNRGKSQVSKRCQRPMFGTALVFWFCMFRGVISFAQVSSGSISGTVVDSQASLVAGAEVKVIDSQTNQEFRLMTGFDGSFRANLLSVGIYRVEISKIGFQKAILRDVSVRAGSNQGLGILQLKVGDIETTIEVGSKPQLITLSEAQISSSFGAETLTTFSGILENNGLDNLALSVPGVVNSRDLGFSAANGAQFAVNGLRGRSNDQQIDGQNNNDNLATGPSLPISDPEFVAEYQITTSNFGAQYGRNAGSVVNVLTKSGTNNLHGSAYAAEGNWRFNALSANQKLFEGLTQVPPFNDAFVGATLGGAIMKDKLFFFGGLDSEILNQAGIFGTGQLTPTPAGIATLAACFPESTSITALKNYGPYAVKAGNPTPQAPAVVENFMNCPGVAMAGIQRALPADGRKYNFVARLDYQTSANHFYGRYIYSNGKNVNSSGNPEAGYPSDLSALSQDFGFSWVRFINDHTANEFRASYGRLSAQDGGNSYGNTVPQFRELGNAITFINFNDPSLLSVGIPISSPQGRTDNTYQVQDNWTQIVGRHALKAGLNFTYLRSSNTVLPNYNGEFRFDDYGALAANVPNRIQIALGNPNLNFREKDTFVYVGDDFKISTNLTLNLGLTWSYFGQPVNLLHDLTTRMQTSSDPLWNPNLPLSVTTVPSTPVPKNSWGPGIGFAWSPENGLFRLSPQKVVVRGGYRLAYDPPYYNLYLKIANSAPSVLLTTLTGSDARANPLPEVITGTNIRALLAPHLQTGIFDPRTFLQTSISPNFGPDRVHEWSLGIQLQIVPNALFEIRYVGNHAQNLFQTINGNPFIQGLANEYPSLVPVGLVPCSVSQAAVPQAAGRISCDGGALVRERTNTGYSDYQSVQTELRSHRLWNQLTLRSAYVFSKTTDNASEIGATLAAGGTFALSQSQVNFKDGEHGLSGFDFPQNWVLTALEELPFQRSEQGFLGHVFGGWKTSGVYTLSSGQPYTAAQSGLNCASRGGACGGIPDDVNPYDPQFNAAFAGPDGSLRPFLGAFNAPVQSVGIFAKDICAVDTNGNLCGNPAIRATTLVSLNEFNNGFTGTKTDMGITIPDPLRPASVVDAKQVRFIANTATADKVFGTPFGNVGRNSLRDSKTNVLNLSIFKTVEISDKFNIQFNADFLNAFNHPNYLTIDPFIDDAGLFAERVGFANPKVQTAGSRAIWFGLKFFF